MCKWYVAYVYAVCVCVVYALHMCGVYGVWMCDSVCVCVYSCVGQREGECFLMALRVPHVCDGSVNHGEENWLITHSPGLRLSRAP